MDKRKVIAAYRRGFISLQECAQLLGIDSLRIIGLVDEAREGEYSAPRKQTINR